MIPALQTGAVQLTNDCSHLNAQACECVGLRDKKRKKLGVEDLNGAWSFELRMTRGEEERVG